MEAPKPIGSTHQGLLRILTAYVRGEREICSIVRVPTVEEEDAKRHSHQPTRSYGICANCLAGTWNTPSIVAKRRWCHLGARIFDVQRQLISAGTHRGLRFGSFHCRSRQTGRAHYRGSGNLLGRASEASGKNPQCRAERCNEIKSIGAKRIRNRGCNGRFAPTRFSLESASGHP
jgi:hypothetical protein